jgi:hypothetical protein
MRAALRAWTNGSRREREKAAERTFARFYGAVRPTAILVAVYRNSHYNQDFAQSFLDR